MLVMGVTMAAVVKCRGGVGVAFGTALGFAALTYCGRSRAISRLGR